MGGNNDGLIDGLDNESLISGIENIFGALADMSELMPGIKGFLNNVNKKKPKLAQGLGVTAKIFKAAGELSGIYPLKLLGVGIAGTAHVLDPKMVSGAAWSHTNIQLNKIYQKLLELEKKSEQILEHLHEIRFKDGMKNIQSHFQAIEKSACVKVWAEQFHHNVSNFATFGKDFEFENLKTVFHYVYSTKCAENFQKLNEIYIYVLTTRILYFNTMITYYQHYPKFSPTEREFSIMKEIDNFNTDVVLIGKSISCVCNYFLAARALPEEYPFAPAFIPEIPETDDLILSSFKHGDGKVYGKDGFMLFIPSKQNSKFGQRLTTKYKKSIIHIKVVKNSPARVVTPDKVLVGTMIEEGNWEGGRIDIDSVNDELIYSKYQNGKRVENSILKFVNYEWLSREMEISKRTATLNNSESIKNESKDERSIPVLINQHRTPFSNLRAQVGTYDGSSSDEENAVSILRKKGLSELAALIESGKASATVNKTVTSTSNKPIVTSASFSSDWTLGQKEPQSRSTSFSSNPSENLTALRGESRIPIVTNSQPMSESSTTEPSGYKFNAGNTTYTIKGGNVKEELIEEGGKKIRKITINQV